MMWKDTTELGEFSFVATGAKCRHHLNKISFSKTGRIVEDLPVQHILATEDSVHLLVPVMDLLPSKLAAHVGVGSF